MGEQDPGSSGLGYTLVSRRRLAPWAGVGNAVGMAVGEAHLGAVFNRDQKILDHNVYFIASDGDMMEVVSHEAASFAGHAKLGKLIDSTTTITSRSRATLLSLQR